jgi:hypothetical protein
LPRLSRSFSKSSASTGQRLGGGEAVVGDGVADLAVRHGLDGGGDVADLAGAEVVRGHHLGGEHADLLDAVHGAGGHHADALAALQAAVLDSHQDDHAEIGVVPAVHQQRLQRRVGITRGGGQAGDQRLQHFGDVQAGLGADHHRVGGVQADHVLDLLLDLVGLGGGKVDFVEDGHDLVTGVDGLVDVGEGLRLDALGGVDHEKGTLAGRQAAADLVGEVDVAGGVDQVEFIGQAVAGLVGEAHALRLDGDAAFLFQVHGVEDLLGHLAGGEAAGGLDQPVGQGGFPVVDMGDDREVADAVGRGVGHSLAQRPMRAGFGAYIGQAGRNVSHGLAGGRRSGDAGRAVSRSGGGAGGATRGGRRGRAGGRGATAAGWGVRRRREPGAVAGARGGGVGGDAAG